MSANSKIKIQNLCKKIGNRVVLDNLNLDLKTGSSLVIIGSSGSGKSLLLKSIVGLVKPDEGRILIDQLDITSLSTHQRFGVMSKCGFLFQGSALFDSLTVEENITFYAQKLYGLTSKEKTILAKEKLATVGLSAETRDLYPAELSGGMKKRVALARAICTDPKIIFLDEPTTGLDPIMSNIINDLIVNIREKLGASTITVTHDIASMYSVATEVAMLYQGKIIWCNTVDKVAKTENKFVQQFISGSTNGPIKGYS